MLSHMCYAHAFEVDLGKLWPNSCVTPRSTTSLCAKIIPIPISQLDFFNLRERLNESLSTIASQPIMIIKISTATLVELDDLCFRLFIRSKAVLCLVDAIRYGSFPALSHKDELKSLKALSGYTKRPTIRYTLRDGSLNFRYISHP